MTNGWQVPKRPSGFSSLASVVPEVPIPPRATVINPAPCDGYLCTGGIVMLLSKHSGAEGSRTLYLLHAMQALSQMSYGPGGYGFGRLRGPEN
jgi:hypothetical protein